ncbi:lamin tail domain-containing protein [Reticulibacter mediterranei]|uniref:lamin tail domain-containing protein n=1 Tax=Reticulibacter mediterranei TaxID=2778369 RepID=UPI001C69243C|nr:lamin tail domain-containing protein [Reticulibacter mediterranei]
MRTLVIASFVLFFLSVTIPFTSLASTHPCAFPTPPVVTGQLTDPSPDAGKLFINEILLAPNANWNCSDTGNPSAGNDTWVEIYNSQDAAYNLDDVRAALDHGEGTDPFYFPVHSAIAPHSFLVVFPRTNPNFFNSETSTLRLIISGIAVDTVSLPTANMATDTSYARIPDGSNTWQILNVPTIGASNPTLQTAISSNTTITAIATLTRTPTPKPSPTPRHTPTPRPSKTSRSSSSKQDGSTIASGGAIQTGSDSSVLIDGTQPAWNKLPVPGSTPSSTASDDTGNTSTNDPLATSDDEAGNNTIRNIEMTVLAILLSGGLLWCWKLFISPVLLKQKK